MLDLTCHLFIAQRLSRSNTLSWNAPMVLASLASSCSRVFFKFHIFARLASLKGDKLRPCWGNNCIVECIPSKCDIDDCVGKDHWKGKYLWVWYSPLIFVTYNIQGADWLFDPNARWERQWPTKKADCWLSHKSLWNCNSFAFFIFTTLLYLARSANLQGELSGQNKTQSGFKEQARACFRIRPSGNLTTVCSSK